MSEPMSEGRLSSLRRRYGSGTSGPNWQAADYADGPTKDALLDQAKADVRELLDEVYRLRHTERRDAARAAMCDLKGMCEHWEHPNDAARLWMIMVNGGDTGRGQDWTEAYREARAVDDA